MAQNVDKHPVARAALKRLATKIQKLDMQVCGGGCPADVEPRKRC